MGKRAYVAIDLKSFYASVECMELGLDPLDTCLVVADESRTEKTIGLAVSPALKKFGVPGRPRLFEVVQKVKEANRERIKAAPGGAFKGKSVSSRMLSNDPSLQIDFLIAKPRMALYMKYSTRIFSIYSRFVSPEDIHVYSIDEVFIDVTDYLKTYRLSARELSSAILERVRGKYSQLPFTVFGPFEADVYKVNDKYRMKMVVKCRLSKASRAMFSELLALFSQKRGVTLAVDLNPLTV